MKSKHKLLLIDDDPTFIDIYTRAFKESGIDYSTAFNGIEAIDKANNENPSLILLDIMMPGIDGFEVLKKLKQNPKTADIEVWMITNLAEKQSEELSSALGASDYLVKSRNNPRKVCEKINQFFSSN